MKTEIDPDLQELIDTIPPNNLLSLKQVAAAVGRSDSYVCELVESGDLRVLQGRGKKRKSVLVLRSSLIRYLKNNIV